MKRLWLFYFLVGLCFTLIAGCSKKGDEGDSEQEVTASNVEVSAARVAKGEIRQLIETGGSLSPLPDHDVKVSSLVPGRVNQLLAQEGDAVKERQVLARIDDSALQDQLRQAKAALDNAEANAQRTAHLFERGIAAAKEKEDAQRDLVTAQTAYDTVRIQVARSVIYSPIAGSVVKRFVSVGEQVDGTAGQPLLEIANFEVVELTAALQTSYLKDIHEGQDAEVATDAYPDRTFPGKIVSILPAINTETNSATLRIRIQNTSGELKGGMFATAHIIAGVHPQALLLPAAALVMTNDEAKVFVIGSDSKVHEKPVEIGWREKNAIEVLKGLNEGDLVVTTGSYGLAEGVGVSVKKS